MIKIQEHLNRVDADPYLDSLAEELWNELNPKVKNGKKYKVASLIEKCKKYATQTATSAYRIEYANNDIATATRHKSFFDFLIASNAAALKSVIVSRPNYFAALKTNISLRINQADLYTGTPGNYSQTAFGKLLSEKIFDYTSFRSSDFCKKLFAKIGFDNATCPYCNNRKLDIVTIRSNSSAATILRAYYDIDHFYPKSLNPFFAVSFFNLIPACHDCNSAEKRSLPFSIETHIHPYHEAFEDCYEFEVPNKCLIGDPVDVILIKSKNNKPLDRTVDDLHLDDRYQNNIGEANKLLTFFLNNWKRNIGTENEPVFIDAIFNLKNVPKEKTNILNSLQGKMNRDILKQVDVNNVLDII